MGGVEVKVLYLIMMVQLIAVSVEEVVGLMKQVAGKVGNLVMEYAFIVDNEILICLFIFIISL